MGQEYRRSEVLEKSAKESDKFYQQNNVLGKKKVLDFSIEDSKDKPLDPLRFHKKPVDESKLSKLEQKKIKQLAKEVKKAKVAEENNPEPEIFDAWANDTAPKRETQKRTVKSVVTPHGGQSYNPSYNDHSALINQEIEREVRKETKVRQVKKKIVVQDFSTKNDKQKKHLFNQLNDIKKDLNN